MTGDPFNLTNWDRKLILTVYVENGVSSPEDALNDIKSLVSRLGMEDSEVIYSGFATVSIIFKTIEDKSIFMLALDKSQYSIIEFKMKETDFRDSHARF